MERFWNALMSFGIGTVVSFRIGMSLGVRGRRICTGVRVVGVGDGADFAAICTGVGQALIP